MDRYNSPPPTSAESCEPPKAPKKCKCDKPNCETCGYKKMMTKLIKREEVSSESGSEYVDLTEQGMDTSPNGSTHTVEEGYSQCNTPFDDLAPKLVVCRPNQWDRKQRVYHFFSVSRNETIAGSLLRYYLQSITLDNQLAKISCAVHKQRIPTRSMAGEFWTVTLSVINPTNGVLDIILEYLISHGYSEHNCILNHPETYGGQTVIRSEWRWQ